MFTPPDPAAFRPWGRADVEQSVAARFADVAAAFPDRPAVEAATETLTYRALAGRADGLAAALAARYGTGPEAVALLLGREQWLIAAQLAVWKRGRPFVVLDPRWPPARQAAVFADAGAVAVVTDMDPASLGGPVVRVDDLVAAAVPDAPVAPTAPAYVLYTSGSTGRPKGVVQSHRIVLHNVLKYTNRLRVTAADRWTLLFHPAFGEAMNDILAAFLNGGCVLPFDVRAEGVGKLAAWLTASRATVYHSVPSVFRHFAAGLTGAEAFPAVRAVCLGGEPVLRTDAAAVRRHFPPGCVLVNALGSTETKLMRMNVVGRDDPLPGPIIPAGDPVPDTEVLLLDAAGEPVPAGDVGEIVVQSEFLADYWRNPDLSRAAYQPDPAGSPARRYRTGDLGRFGPGGLEVLGRRDNQVKLRGYRIDLGEIEAALLACPGVAMAAAVVLDATARPRLVAAVAPGVGATLAGDRLRATLAERLPAYMVPAAVTVFDTLPTTDSGKVDRRALTERLTEAAVARVPPRNADEAVMAAVWAAVLGRHDVGADDDFFTAGGDSLLAARLIDHVSRTLGADLRLADIYATPTLAGLARRAASARQAGRPAARCLDIVRPGDGPPVVCVGIWNPLRGLLASVPSAVPVWWLRADGLDRPIATVRPLADMAAAFVAELELAVPGRRVNVVGFSFGGLLAYEVAIALRRAGWRVTAVLVEPSLDTHWSRPPVVAEPAPRESRLRRLAQAFVSQETRADLAAALRWRFLPLANRLRLVPWSSLSYDDRLRCYWDRIEARIREYTPTPTAEPMHLFGRPDWLTRFAAEWRAVAPNLTVHPMPCAATHDATCTAPADADWLRVVC